MVKRGSSEDFWRAADAGRRLAAEGWTPGSLEIDRVFRIRVGTRPAKFRHRLTLNRYGCHARVWPELGKGPSLSKDLCADALRSAGFRVDRLLRHENGVLGLRWPVRSLGDLHGATRTRKDRWRVKIPAARRGRFILHCLKRRRFWERRGWQGFYLEFKTYRNFRSSGMRWVLNSAHYFALREGFYWVITMAPVVGSRKYRTLLRTGYLHRVAQELRRTGFRVLSPGRHGLVFDQDFLPSSELLRKSRLLLQWRPPKIGPSPSGRRPILSRSRTVRCRRPATT